MPAPEPLARPRKIGRSFRFGFGACFGRGAGVEAIVVRIAELPGIVQEIRMVAALFRVMAHPGAAG